MTQEASYVVSLDRPSLNIEQARAKVGVARRTIYHWLKAGKLEYFRTAGGSIRIYTDTLTRPGRQEDTRSC